MNNNHGDTVWWAHLTADDVEALNEVARNSPLPIFSYPYADPAMEAELVAWSNLEVEVLESHSAWLSKLKFRCESAGPAVDASRISPHDSTPGAGE